jgi:Flp pilus assembly protein TadD
MGITGAAKTEPSPKQQTPTQRFLTIFNSHAYEVRSRSSGPIAASRAALALRPNYAEAWNNIGAAYNKLGRYDKAGAACEEALRLKPDFQLARNNLQYAREMAKSLAK